ncbi:MAG: DnaA regulatory inactivator Hda [Burkholderiales bacterium RIFCSPLOWO2_02_FULL_57_36]|nr:MAG: DnaA regulatory inactivator Hda [Burkholderiales bacterium RIFCSPLOWO2_02_FULL_57_36]
MKQLLLDLGADKPQDLDTFVIGKNDELMQLLQRFAHRATSAPSERFVYLWGEPGAGKTHLLQALAATPYARYIAAESHADAFLFTPETTLYLIDDCQILSPDLQIAAFNLFNQVREHDASLLVTGAVPPAMLQLREDLRTRLGWGLIYQLHGLTDDEKIAALNHAAAARGLVLPPGVLPYLLTHFRRDMRSLSAMLDALDRYSLETQRPITLPLLRSLLQQENEPAA